MRDVIILGAGILGCSLALEYRNRGRDVLLLDTQDPEAGTGLCGGSVKPSNLTGMSPEELRQSLATLDRLWGLYKEDYVVMPRGIPLGHPVWRIDMQKVWGVERLQVRSTHIWGRGTPDLRVEYTQDTVIIDEKPRLLIVAAGAGTPRLLPDIFPPKAMSYRRGVSFLWQGQVERPWVQTWAPYKQVTVHNFGPQLIWAADGSSLKPENWPEGRSRECRERIKEAMGTQDNPVACRHGVRTFCSNSLPGESGHRPCFLYQFDNHAWVAVGAGKFGCLAAGWATWRLREVS